MGFRLHTMEGVSTRGGLIERLVTRVTKIASSVYTLIMLNKLEYKYKVINHIFSEFMISFLICL